MNRLPKASFFYRFGTVDSKRILLIWDLNLGTISLRNDIENVVDSIGERESIDPKMYSIIYRDSEGRWDGWDHLQQGFISLSLPDSLKDNIQEHLNFSFEDPRPILEHPDVGARSKKGLEWGMGVLDETARRNRVMFSGYQRLVHYLATSQECNPQDIKNIIADVMDQI